MDIFKDVTGACSRLITHRYSTSFSYAVKLLDRPFHQPIYNIYGFVRLADEIVDTFHHQDQAELLTEFREDTWKSIDRKFSLNPVLHSFQQTVNDYGIHRSLIETFLKSMETDLETKQHTLASYHTYILGSAEVVGLMCLKVFCEGNTETYENLKKSAMALGAAFQKINFLRDFTFDQEELGRFYFPYAEGRLNAKSKKTIEEEIEADMKLAREGIMKLPPGCRMGVYSAYLLYQKLFVKLKKLPAAKIRENRIRVANPEKVALLAEGYIRHRFNYI